MQQDFTKLRQALKDSADGPYAVGKMRELLVELLRDYPRERYQVADLLLPHGRPINQNSRKVVKYLIEQLEESSIEPEDILDLAGAFRMMCG
ncbi:MULTISPECIES: hypothetical protein [Pseudomonas]|uniref:hypothetical protein n=1 Tax=Pseudomonas TaxID=286 RepID=UPI001DB4DCEA|nr:MULTISPECIES: hypothetical protein [Pseudomonas]MBS6036502.1 hypothetical protein [Pseudomonas sp.]MCZ9639647.1 hypothetical protein [Pseudomonas putida]